MFRNNRPNIKFEPGQKVFWAKKKIIVEIELYDILDRTYRVKLFNPISSKYVRFFLLEKELVPVTPLTRAIYE